MPSSVDENVESFENTIDFHLVKKICSPLDSLNTKSILLEIKKRNRLGSDHLLYVKYQKKYGDNRMGTNIIVPYVDELEDPSKTPKIKSLVLISHPYDSARLGKKHVKKMLYFSLFFMIA